MEGNTPSICDLTKNLSRFKHELEGVWLLDGLGNFPNYQVSLRLNLLWTILYLNIVVNRIRDARGCPGNKKPFSDMPFLRKIMMNSSGAGIGKFIRVHSWVTLCCPLTPHLSLLNTLRRLYTSCWLLQYESHVNECYFYF